MYLKSEQDQETVRQIWQGINIEEDAWDQVSNVVGETELAAYFVA